MSVQAPEITVPLSSKSRDIAVLDLGQLILANVFHVGFSKERGVAIYEQYNVKLTQLQVYR